MYARFNNLCPFRRRGLLLLVEVAHLCEESVILYRMKKVKCSEKPDINFLVATQRESMKLTRNY